MSLPRIRGGVSNAIYYFYQASRSSPHTRGCFQRSARSRGGAQVFPAYAGVFLNPAKLLKIFLSLPRIRGGVSVSPRATTAYFRSSPHTRGCFHLHDACARWRDVFPAYAGVFLVVKQRARPLPGLPRIRGGVSLGEVCLYDREESSPHTRGCFLLPVLRIAERVVFPAYAGVFLPRDGILQTWISLPRIRGGVSMKDSSMAAVVLSSPHTRGCFYSCYDLSAPARVFPAYAGVFLPCRSAQKAAGSLPRIRGGVSEVTIEKVTD